MENYEKEQERLRQEAEARVAMNDAADNEADDEEVVVAEEETVGEEVVELE